MLAIQLETGHLGPYDEVAFHLPVSRMLLAVESSKMDTITVPSGFSSTSFEYILALNHHQINAASYASRLEDLPHPPARDCQAIDRKLAMLASEDLLACPHLNVHAEHCPLAVDHGTFCGRHLSLPNGQTESPKSRPLLQPRSSGSHSSSHHAARGCVVGGTSHRRLPLTSTYRYLCVI